MQQVCKELVDYLVVGVTNSAIDLVGPRTVQARVGLHDFYPSPAVISHSRDHVLYQQLTGLLPTAAAVGDPEIVEITASMNNIASDMHHDLAVRETRCTEAHKPSTLHKKHGDRTADMLLLLTRSSDDEDLPEYYINVSDKPKGLSNRIVLQREVGAAAEASDLIPFQVTPSQVIAVKTYDFYGASYSEIGTEVLPFSITPADATFDKGRAAIQADRNRVKTSDLGRENVNGTMTVDNASKMRNCKGYVAHD
jgi:hypothetical protein